MMIRSKGRGHALNNIGTRDLCLSGLTRSNDLAAETCHCKLCPRTKIGSYKLYKKVVTYVSCHRIGDKF